MVRKEDNDEEGKEIKVEKWDQNAVRLALDDGAKKVILDNLKFEEDFGLIDTRLLICTTAVMFSLFALVWDYLYPFPASKPIILVCVVSYFLLMGVLSLYSTFKEKNIFLVARQKDKAGIDPDIVWTLSSTMNRFSSDYGLEINVCGPGNNGEAEFTRCVGEFFDTNGELLFDKYEPAVMALYKGISPKKKRQ